MRKEKGRGREDSANDKVSKNHSKQIIKYNENKEELSKGEDE
jgi:hypothetical protein